MALSTAEQLLYCTVRIEAIMPDGKTVSTGSGFCFTFSIDTERSVPAIVTNKHVVAGATAATFRFHQQDGNKTPIQGQYITLTVTDFDKAWIGHPDSNVDICIIPITGIINELDQSGQRPFFVTLDDSTIATTDTLESLSPIEDIIMIGYPNGIWDSVNNMPIIRRGITATRPGTKYDGNEEFIIDAAVYPGSSGSPVFLYNQGSYATPQGIAFGTRVFLLGILYKVFLHSVTGEIIVQNIPTTQIPVPRTSIPNNLGIVIRATKLLDFVPVLETLLAKASAKIATTTDTSTP